MSNELNKIRKLISDNVWDILAEFDAIIAGGAVTSVYTNKEINDFDVYFRSEELFTQFIHSIYSKDHDTLENLGLISDAYTGDLRCVNMTEKSLLLMDTDTGAKIQLIVYKFFKDSQEIFDKFDFVHNMGALECKTEKFVLHENFLKCNAQRYMDFNPNTSFPLISLLRVKKYTDRGYTISKSQFLRIALKCTQLPLNSWEDVRNQCGGMYGLNMNEVFKDEYEFSIDKAIEILSTLQTDEKFDMLSSMNCTIEFSTIKEKFKHMFKYPEDTRELLSPSRIFKNVGVDSNGEMISLYRPTFKYVLGGVLDGGESGVFAYRGYDVVTGIYASETGYILELEPMGEVRAVKEIYPSTSTKTKYQLMGNVRVINRWKLADFKKQFKGE